MAHLRCVFFCVHSTASGGQARPAPDSTQSCPIGRGARLTPVAHPRRGAATPKQQRLEKIRPRPPAPSSISEKGYSSKGLPKKDLQLDLTRRPEKIGPTPCLEGDLCTAQFRLRRFFVPISARSTAPRTSTLGVRAALRTLRRLPPRRGGSLFPRPASPLTDPLARHARLHCSRRAP